MDSYRISDYAFMLRDHDRVSRFRRALGASVSAESRVLEIGTGVGFFAVIAARLGAASVTAVELGDVVYLARSVLEANGVADRVLLLQGDSRDLDNSLRFDVVVSDLRGVLPWYGDHLSAVTHAREHLLAQGGVLIPEADEVRVCLVADERLYTEVAAPWELPLWGVDLTPVRPFALNSWTIVNLGEESAATESAQLAIIDYHAGVGDEFSGAATWNLAASVTLHGFVVWTKMHLGFGDSISNAPGRKGSTYGQAFFPFEHPLRGSAGDSVDVQFRVLSELSGYDFEWRTSHHSAGETLIAEYAQSSSRGRIAGSV